MTEEKQKEDILARFGLEVLLEKLIEHENNAIDAYINAHAAEESRRDFITFLLNWIEAYKNEEVNKAWEDGFSKGIESVELSEKRDEVIIKGLEEYLNSNSKQNETADN